MVSLVFYSISSISNLIPKSHRTFTNSYNIPFPSIFHRILDESYIQQFEEVFVIGDVHGCYDELKALLEQTGAERSSVLKIFVGDLVNKGPKNNEVLDLVRSSNSMLSVRGNHDEIVLKEFFDLKNQDAGTAVKYPWIKQMSEDNMNMLVELPYTISIPSLNCVIVHAGLLPGLPLGMNDPNDMTHMRNIVEMERFWEKELVAVYGTDEGEPWAEMWGGPQHVYFGHDARRMLQTCYRATGLDTGCVYGNYLTGIFIYGPRKGKMYQVKAAREYRDT